MAARTPMQRARKGGFKDMSVQELLIAFFKVRRHPLALPVRSHAHAHRVRRPPSPR